MKTERAIVICQHAAIATLTIAIVLLPAASAPAQNLFESDLNMGWVNEFMPDGNQSRYAPGIACQELTFNSAGDLFGTEYSSSRQPDGNYFIAQIEPGAYSGYSTGLTLPWGLAFDSAGHLFVANSLPSGSGYITEIPYTGPSSAFASGLNNPRGLAFNSAGDLFVADWGSANIYEFTPGGVKSTFASGLSYCSELAFDGAGNLFVGESSGGNIIKITPSGVQSTFATGLVGVVGLAFDSTGNLFVATDGSGQGDGAITEITPGGVQSTFASGLNRPAGLAFQGVTLPVPEPATWAIVVLGAVALLGSLRLRCRSV